MGKTGLIHHIFHDEQIQRDFLCLYFDAFTCGNIEEFTFSLCNCIFRSLKGQVGVFETIPRILKSLELPFQINTKTEQPEISLCLGAINHPEQTLQEAFSFLNSYSKPVILAIDEFQQVASFKHYNAVGFIRGLVQNCCDVRMIYTGSAAHLLSNLFLQGKSPFYQSASMMHLEAISPDVYYRFAKDKFEEAGKTITQEFFDETYKRFSGCTWYVQSVLNRVFANTLTGQTVSSGTLDRTVGILIDEQDVFYRSLLSTLSFTQKALLFAIAKEGTATNPTSAEFTKKHQLPSASSVQSAMRPLVERGILQKTEKGLKIYDYFFAEWIKNRLL